MKRERLSVRIEKERLEKLRLYADHKKKSMTRLIEDWIDRLKLEEEKKR